MNTGDKIRMITDNFYKRGQISENATSLVHEIERLAPRAFLNHKSGEPEREFARPTHLKLLLSRSAAVFVVVIFDTWYG